ncbi:Hypothetical predicted protein, partial [Olea europaea subsp. europaea]
MALQDVRQHLPGHRSILGPTRYFEMDSPDTFREDIDDAYHYLSSFVPLPQSGLARYPIRQWCGKSIVTLDCIAHVDYTAWGPHLREYARGRAFITEAEAEVSRELELKPDCSRCTRTSFRRTCDKFRCLSRPCSSLVHGRYKVHLPLCNASP